MRARMRKTAASGIVMLALLSGAFACGDGTGEDFASQDEALRRGWRNRDAGTTHDSGTTTGTDAGTTTGTDAGTTTRDSGTTTGTDAGSGGATSTDCGPVKLGAGASLGGTRMFPDDNPWNQDVSATAVDPNNDAILQHMGLTTPLHPDFGASYAGEPNGIPYVVVGPTQPLVPITFTDYGDESDPGPYPVPGDAPVEGGANATGDRHVLVVQCSGGAANHLGGLFELFAAFPQANGSWNAASGAKFDANSNALRPAGWTSADAAGLPVFAGLVRYDEVIEQREIRHALRFTVRQSRRAYVAPARHFASSNTDPTLPPMGMRMRLKQSFDVSTFPASVQVILTALKRYGMLLADNGSSGYISGAPDDRWSDSDLHALSKVTFASFEIVQMGTIVTQ
jgi:hypothetical protein